MRPSRLRAGHILGWAIYLGMSWTWCIGMYLPVLLLRDLGDGGFLIFAIPNILGAAAMGWVLSRRRQSEEMVERHTAACVWFSLVTIIFHAFFAAWIIRRVGGHWAAMGIAAVLAAFWMIFQWRKGGKFLGAALALLVSVIAMAWGFSRPELPLIAQPINIPGRGLPPIDILWLAPLCIFGFGLCPYLDLTFHHARQEMTANESRAAFVLGFVGFFAPMILFTRAYSGHLITGGFARELLPQLALILCAHFIVQSCFTVAAHVQQLGARLRTITVRKFTLFCGAFILAVFLGMISRPRYHYHGLELGEIFYRCFLGFYALIFPAYVWLCVLPPKRSLRHLAAAVIVAAPFFWLAMIEQQMIFAVPGVVVPIAAKLVGERKTFPANV